ncbi:MAG: hypothetical protein WDM85_06135 [Caulobacteraceae bacterium]
MTDRTTVRLPEELVLQAKRKAAAEGRTLTSLIEEGLRRVVSEKRDTAAKKPVMPRVSTAKGWLRPGIADLREVRELEDLEYVRKLRRL